MSGDQIVFLISIFMCLVLAVNHSGFRRLSWSQGARMAMIWVGIFVVVALFISIVTGEQPR